MRKSIAISIVIFLFTLTTYASSFLITDGIGFTNIPEINDTGITVNISANYNLTYVTAGITFLGIFPVVYTTNHSLNIKRLALLGSIGYLMDNYSINVIAGVSNVPFGYSIDNGYVPVVGISNQLVNISYDVGSYANLTILSPAYINNHVGLGAPIFIFTIGEALN